MRLKDSVVYSELKDKFKFDALDPSMLELYEALGYICFQELSYSFAKCVQPEVSFTCMVVIHLLKKRFLHGFLSKIAFYELHRVDF